MTSQMLLCAITMLALMTLSGCGNRVEYAADIEPAAATAIQDEAAVLPGPVLVAAGGPLPRIVRDARDAIVAHAPYKQFDPVTNRYDMRIGRTPATACDAIIFLNRYLIEKPTDSRARAKLDELVAWVLTLQDLARSEFGIASVPSTPDADPPANAYFYAIDAAICGRAMVVANAITGEPQFRQAAIGFGETLLDLSDRQAMYFEGTGNPGGFCEYVRFTNGVPAYNCDTYTKNLVALGFLRDLKRMTGRRDFNKVARRARAFLLPGLKGGWEKASVGIALQCGTSDCPQMWERVQGPYGEPDRYIYGDSVAYALEGLFEFEGATPRVKRLYRQYAKLKGTHHETLSYDGTVAWAGYIDMNLEEPDFESAYYDVVTIGILSKLRRAIAPNHDRKAFRFVDRAISNGRPLSWGLGFDGQSIGVSTIDIVTYSTLGAATLASLQDNDL